MKNEGKENVENVKCMRENVETDNIEYKNLENEISER